MSCRVLGRGLEGPALQGLLEAARRDGRTRLVGLHVPSGRNEPAARAYRDAGFTPDGPPAGDGSTRWVLPVEGGALLGDHVRVDLPESLRRTP